MVVGRHLSDRSFGRVRLRFPSQSQGAELPTAEANTPTGRMVVETPELTATELADRPHDGEAWAAS